YQAVLDMAYQRSVRSDGITPWHDLVKIAVDAAVTDYIRAHRFDDLTAPRFTDADPRDEITNKLNSEGTKTRLKGVGAELLWADMGHFETVDEQVDQQRLETWGAKWIGNAEVQRAFGEARRISYQEFGRAEAQAEMLVSIMEALDDTDWPEDADEDERVRNIILTRTAQILDGMADRDFSTNRQSDDFPPPVSENRG
ncbi:MAG: hypothetical protein U9Q82_16025, partial [Chloroflexota bacterium]|nr:hypothetical protein [Chloroflexota bacterium]